ncbi:unnamed protein product [Closterium sp. Naga37s-1]|nr:unnamed protein product [Closterium sp. Naga37s-1]
MELAEPTEPDDGEAARVRGVAEEAREAAQEVAEEAREERELARELRELAREAEEERELAGEERELEQEEREVEREERELEREEREVAREVRELEREVRERREAVREARERREAVREALAAVTEGGARPTQEVVNLMIYRAVNPMNEDNDDDDSSLDDHGDSGDDSEEEEDEEANNEDMEAMEARAARDARDAEMAEEGEIVMTDEGDMLDDDTDDDDIDEDDDDDDSDDDSENDYNEFEDPHYNERRRSVLRVASAIAAAPVDDWGAVKGAEVHEEAKYLLDNTCSTYRLPSGVCHHQCCDTLVAGPGPVASAYAAHSSARDDAAPAPPSLSHSPSSAPSSSAAPPPTPPFSQEIICTVQRMVTLYSTARREVVAVTSLPSEPYSVDRFGDVVVAGCYGTVCFYLIRREVAKKTAGWTKDGAPERTSHPAHHHHHHYQPQQQQSGIKGAAGAAVAEEEEEEEEEERVWFEAAGMVGGFESSLIGSSMCNSVRFGTVGNWVRMLVAHQNGYLYVFTLPPPFQPATSRHVGRSDWVFSAQSLEDARQMALESRCRTSQEGSESGEPGKEVGEGTRRAAAAGGAPDPAATAAAAATTAAAAATAAVTAYGGGSAGLDLSMSAAEGSEGRAASATAAAVASAAAAAAVPAHYPAGSVPLNVKINLRDLTTVDMPTSAPVTIRSAPAGGLVRTSARLVNAIGPFPMPLNFALVSPNGEWIAVIGDLAAVCVLDRASGFRVSGMASRRIPVASRNTRGAAHGCQYLAWNPSSSLLAVSSDSLKAVYVWGVSRISQPRASEAAAEPSPSKARPFTRASAAAAAAAAAVAAAAQQLPSGTASSRSAEPAAAPAVQLMPLVKLDQAFQSPPLALQFDCFNPHLLLVVERCSAVHAVDVRAPHARQQIQVHRQPSSQEEEQRQQREEAREDGLAARATVGGVVGGMVDAAQDQLRRRLHQLEQLLQRRNQPPVSDVVGLAAYFHPGVLVSTETTVFQVSVSVAGERERCWYWDALSRHVLSGMQRNQPPVSKVVGLAAYFHPGVLVSTETTVFQRNQPPVSKVVGLAAYFHPGVLVSTETTVFQVSVSVAGERERCWYWDALSRHVLSGMQRNQPPVSKVVGLAAYFHPGVLVSTETTVFQYPRMGAWTPASHHLYPKRFREVVRLLLLGHYSTGQWDYGAAADDHSSQSQSDSRYLWLLPLEVLLQVIGHAATPLSVWISDA